jgi:mannosyltransferase OCH1-like enzyme
VFFIRQIVCPHCPTEMGNFFEDLVHQIMEATMEDDDQTALKVRTRCRSASYSYHHLTQKELNSKKAKFHKLKSEVIDDVRDIFPHGQITVRVRVSSYYLLA